MIYWYLYSFGLLTTSSSGCLCPPPVLKRSPIEQNRFCLSLMICWEPVLSTWLDHYFLRQDGFPLWIVYSERPSLDKSNSYFYKIKKKKLFQANFFSSALSAGIPSQIVQLKTVRLSPKNNETNYYKLLTSESKYCWILSTILWADIAKFHTRFCFLVHIFQTLGSFFLFSHKIWLILPCIFLYTLFSWKHVEVKVDSNYVLSKICALTACQTLMGNLMSKSILFLFLFFLNALIWIQIPSDNQLSTIISNYLQDK